MGSNKGGEYCGRFNDNSQNPRPFAKFLGQNDIIAQYTMPGTPQRNGIAERRSCTLIDVVRSMIINSPLLIFVWGEALKTDMHILTRVPSKIVWCP